MQRSVLWVSLALTLVLTACGGGGGGDDGGAGNPVAPTPTPTPTPQILTGIFVDAPVQGLNYVVTSGEAGTTDSQGRFSYQADGQITFSLGKLQLPEVAAAGVVTPLTLFSTQNLYAPVVRNFIRLLQSLDADQNPDNGIVLDALAVEAMDAAGFTLEDLSLPVAQFEQSTKVVTLLAAMPRLEALLDDRQALAHFADSLANSTLLDTDNDGVANSLDPDDDNDGVADDADVFTWDATEHQDFDRDGLGDNHDADDDNDGIADSDDAVLELVDELPALGASVFDSLAHSDSGYLFLSYRNEQKLRVLDLQSGQLVKTFSFDQFPERMTLSPDGQHLYVALPIQAHSSYWWEEEQTGHVARIDISQLLVDKTYNLATDPFDLAVTSNDQLVVASGSGQWTDINLYRASSGELLSSASIRQASLLALNPDQKTLYATDTDTSATSYQIYRIDGDTIVQVSHSIYLDYQAEGDSWVTPDGKYTITGWGHVVQTSDMTLSKVLVTGATITRVTFDPASGLALAALSDNRLLLVNLSSMEVIEERSALGALLYVGIHNGYLQIYSVLDGVVIKSQQVHPCPQCQANTAPSASFSFSSASSDLQSPYQFDGSSSMDSESTELSYRWDFQADGQWDTDFSQSAQAEFQFSLPGLKYVRLQVKDPQGLLGSVTRSFQVVHGVGQALDYANAEANNLEYKITHSLHDTVRGKLYITSNSEKRLYIVDVATGITERYLQFSLEPDRMAMAVDGGRLYVALLAQARSGYFSGEEADVAGYVATVDLDDRTHINTYPVGTDPWDLAVNAAGKLLVSPGRGWNTNLYAYTADTGSLLGKTSLGTGQQLVLSSSGNSLYAVDDSYIRQFSLNTAAPELALTSDYNYTNGPEGMLWPLAGSDRLLTGRGAVYDRFTLAVNGGLVGWTGTIVKAVVDESQKLVFVLSSNGSLSYYQLETLEKVGDIDVTGIFRDLWLIDGRLLVRIAQSDYLHQLRWLNHPCPDCGANTEPVAQLTSTPTDSGNTQQNFVFDASSSTDAESAELLYRWDLDGDGQWDGNFSTVATASRHFYLPGNFTVGVQVKDEGGLLASTSIALSVSQAVIAAETVSDAVANQLDFTADQTLYHGNSGKYFSIDTAAGRLYRVDGATGVTESYIPFIYQPSRMAISQDGSKIYLSLITQPFSDTRPLASQTGYVAIVDVATFVHESTLSAPFDPYDLVDSGSGNLIIASGSGGSSTRVYAINSADGAVRNSVNCSYRCSLVADPVAGQVYASSSSGNGSGYLYQFNTSAEGMSFVTSRYFSGTTSVSLGRVWLVADGSMLVAASGQLFSPLDLSSIGILQNAGTLVSLVYDTQENLLFALNDEGYVAYFNATTYEYVGAMSVSANARELFMIGGDLIVQSGTGASSQLQYPVHPCPLCGENTAPVASFTYSSDNNETDDLFTLDASASSDAEDGSSLQYRWDIDDDGEWDGAFSVDATAETRFFLSGSYRVHVQVKDSGGLYHTTSQTLEVTQGVDEGVAVSGSTAGVLNFAVSDYLVDSARQSLWISDKGGKALYKVNLSTGLTERRFEFPYAPESLALAADGSKLYVALLGQEHSSYWWEEDQFGFIGIFDLEQSALVKVYSVATDPYDMVLTSAGKLVISSGSGQWTDIYAYNADTGAVLGKSSIRQQSRLTLHPSENWVFAADTESSPSDIEKFDISGVAITGGTDSPYHGHHRMSGNVWALATGVHLVTRGGDIFLASDMSYVSALTAVGISVKSVVSTAADAPLWVLDSDLVVSRYNASTFSLHSSSSAYSGATGLFELDGNVYVIRQSGAAYTYELVTTQ